MTFQGHFDPKHPSSSFVDVIDDVYDEFYHESMKGHYDVSRVFFDSVVIAFEGKGCVLVNVRRGSSLIINNSRQADTQEAEEERMQ